MTGRVETADGKVYELPALLEWRLRRTGGVPFGQGAFTAPRWGRR